MELSIYRYAKELTTSTERFSRSRPYAENPMQKTRLLVERRLAGGC